MLIYIIGKILVKFFYLCIYILCIYIIFICYVILIYFTYCKYCNNYSDSHVMVAVMHITPCLPTANKLDEEEEDDFLDAKRKRHFLQSMH